MLALLKYQFSHLTDFSGRDARPTFWWWVLFLFVIQFALGIVLAIPMTIATMGSAFEAATSGAGEEAMAAQMFSEMAGWMKLSMLSGVVLGLVAMLMGAGSFVRRLHDSGLSGWWALIPLGTQLAGSYVSYDLTEKTTALFAQATDAESLNVAQLELAASAMPWSLIGWVGLIVIIVAGIRASTQGPNSYGEAPVQLAL